MKRAMVTVNGPVGSAAMRWSVVVAMLVSAGCVRVQAPDKPIEINLNVNIRQEVVYRLQQAAEELIENNPELFPQ